MSAHSYIRIGSCYFFAAREGYIREFAAIFQDSERPPDQSDDEWEYVLPAWAMRERLDALGYTIPIAHRQIASAYDEAGDNEETFSEWLSRSTAGISDEDVGCEEVQMWLAHLEPRLILRAVLETVPGDVEVALHLSELVRYDLLTPRPDFCSSAFSELHAQAAAFGPLVVLSEGTTDAEFLGKALAILYPHLREYVKFLDYGFRPEGGAAALVRMVRAFAAAGIGNRIVALFDNDTAAAEALTALDVSSLPANFRVLQLPHLPLAAAYPTLGPSGESNVDVNGLACSLEMFFGTDILTRPTGGFIPVQWLGYSNRLQRYQGEVTDKPSLHRAFRTRAGRAQRRGSIGPEDDWSGMRLVLEALLRSLNEPLEEQTAQSSNQVASE